MLQNASNSIVADNLTVVSSKIQIYALSATEGRTIVYGSNELSKFNIICASGLKAFAGDNDILCYNESYIPDYVATIGENSYLSWQGLWNASVVATEEPINVSILKNIDVSARYINNVKNTNVIFDGPNDSATLTNTNSNKSQTMFEANAGSTTFKNIKFVSADQRTNSAITVQSRLSIENCDFSNYNTTQNAIYIKNDGTATVSDSKLQSISIAEKGRLNLGANCDIESISIGISAQGKYPCIYVDDNFNDVALTFGDTPDFTLILQKTLISGTADATKFTLPDDVQSYMLKPNADNTGLMLDTKVQNGVEDVMAEDADAPVEWFNLQGIRVANPENGIYIRRQGNKVEKVVL